MNMPIYLGIMTLPKTLVVVLAMLTLCLLAGCSVQKRTTAPGWHVEKATNLFHQTGPSSCLTPDAKSESPSLARMNRIPPRVLERTTSAFPADTSAVDAELRKQVTRALQREIKKRTALLMFPNGLSSDLRKRKAEKWHDRAEQICKEQGQFLNDVAPDEFAKLESLRYPGRETMKELKRKKKMLIMTIVLSYFVVALASVWYLATFLVNPWGGG
jgi:hypothetical protein